MLRLPERRRMRWTRLSATPTFPPPLRRYCSHAARSPARRLHRKCRRAGAPFPSRVPSCCASAPPACASGGATRPSVSDSPMACTRGCLLRRHMHTHTRARMRTHTHTVTRRHARKHPRLAARSVLPATPFRSPQRRRSHGSARASRGAARLGWLRAAWAAWVRVARRRHRRDAFGVALLALLRRTPRRRFLPPSPSTPPPHARGVRERAVRSRRSNHRTRAAVRRLCSAAPAPVDRAQAAARVASESSQVRDARARALARKRMARAAERAAGCRAACGVCMRRQCASERASEPVTAAWAGAAGVGARSAGAEGRGAEGRAQGDARCGRGAAEARGAARRAARPAAPRGSGAPRPAGGQR